MSFEFAYRIKQDVPRPSLRDLDDVVLLTATVSDDGDVIQPGAQGTIVSVHGEGSSFVVEFDEPDGALATVSFGQIELAPATGR